MGKACSFFAKSVCFFLMIWQKLFFAFLIFLIGFTACVSKQKIKAVNQLSENQILKMNRAEAFLEQKKFLKAALIYQELSQTLKESSIKSFMLFNAGSAYRSSGQCQKAVIHFQKLLDGNLKNPVFKSRALMEISLAYECLGEKELSFLALKDLEPFLSFLPWNWSQMLHPARLALVGARLGKRLQAKKYQSLSLTKALQFRKAFSTEKEMKEQMSRLFYLMGRSYIKTEHIEFESFLNAFSYHQSYLLQSLFLNHKKWSTLSKEELKFLFEKLQIALSQIKNKKKYRKPLLKDIEMAKDLIKRENFKEWEHFYHRLSQPVLNFFSIER